MRRTHDGLAYQMPSVAPLAACNRTNLRYGGIGDLALVGWRGATVRAPALAAI